MSAQYPPFARPARLDDRLGVGGGGDVRVRQPLDADEQAVGGGPVAEPAERLGGVLDRPLVRTDGLQVAAAELVGQLVGQRLAARALGGRRA